MRGGSGAAGTDAGLSMQSDALQRAGRFFAETSADFPDCGMGSLHRPQKLLASGRGTYSFPPDNHRHPDKCCLPGLPL